MNVARLNIDRNNTQSELTSLILSLNAPLLTNPINTTRVRHLSSSSSSSDFQSSSVSSFKRLIRDQMPFFVISIIIVFIILIGIAIAHSHLTSHRLLQVRAYANVGPVVVFKLSEI